MAKLVGSQFKRELEECVFVEYPLGLLPPPSFHTADLGEGGHDHLDLLSVFEGCSIVNGKRA